MPALWAELGWELAPTGHLSVWMQDSFQGGHPQPGQEEAAG